MNNTEERHMLVVPEKQERIEKIEKAYEEMTKTDNKKKILEALGKGLKAATTIVGIITVIDWIVPDPVLGLDEIALTALTTLLGSATTIVDNKIAQLDQTGEVDVSMTEVQTLAKQIGDAKNKILASRSQMAK